MHRMKDGCFLGWQYVLTIFTSWRHSAERLSCESADGRTEFCLHCSWHNDVQCTALTGGPHFNALDRLGNVYHHETYIIAQHQILGSLGYVFVVDYGSVALVIKWRWR